MIYFLNFLNDIVENIHIIIGSIIKIIKTFVNNIQFVIVIQSHKAVNHAQINHHTIECVVETGALKKVAIFTQRAAHASVAIIIEIN